MNVIFGVDVGGTEIKIGKFIDDKLMVKDVIATDVSNSGNNILSDIFKYLKAHLQKDEKLLGIGIGLPGPVKGNKVLGAQNLGWKVKDVVSEAREYFPQTLIRLSNDANAAALGESYYGAAKGFKNVVMLTMGTGLGGGLIINGHIYEGNNGSSGEVGHICIKKNGRKCSCGLNGCLEQYVSATGIVNTALELRLNKDTLLNKNDLTCKDVFDLAKKGDKIANEVVEEATDDLAIGIASICNTLNPELVVLGGGVSKAGNFLLEKVVSKFEKYAFYSIRNTSFTLATLGNDAGIYGCFHLIKEYFDEN